MVRCKIACLGENKTSTADAGAITSFNVQYSGGPLYAGLAYQTEKADGNATSKNFTRINGTYDLGVAKVLVGYGKVAAGDAETTEWELGADFPVSSTLVLSGGIAKSSDNAASVTPDASRKGLGLAAAYIMSKRTTLYGGFRLDTETISGSDIDTRVFAVGVKHTF